MVAAKATRIVDPAARRTAVECMNYRQFASQITAGYDRGADQYRRDDEVEALTENHRRVGGNLRRICRSFPEPIRILEIGCGTGRYFHWLENAKELVGTDLSAEMLRHARHPLRAHEVTVPDIRLIQGNVYEMELPPGSFDFIYTLGVFGYGAAFTVELAQKLHTWLAPNGRLYFDALENPPPPKKRLKQRVRRAVYACAPGHVKTWLDARERAGVPIVRHTREQIETAMHAAGFEDFLVSTIYCNSPLWTGMKFECSARKPAAAVSRPGSSRISAAPTAAAA